MDIHFVTLCYLIPQAAIKELGEEQMAGGTNSHFLLSLQYKSCVATE